MGVVIKFIEICSTKHLTYVLKASSRCLQNVLIKANIHRNIRFVHTPLRCLQVVTKTFCKDKYVFENCVGNVSPKILQHIFKTCCSRYKFTGKFFLTIDPQGLFKLKSCSCFNKKCCRLGKQKSVNSSNSIHKCIGFYNTSQLVPL